jgi:hypothetical protein
MMNYAFNKFDEKFEVLQVRFSLCIYTSQLFCFRPYHLVPVEYDVKQYAKVFYCLDNGNRICLFI